MDEHGIAERSARVDSHFCGEPQARGGLQPCCCLRKVVLLPHRNPPPVPRICRRMLMIKAVSRRQQRLEFARCSPRSKHQGASGLFFRRSVQGEYRHVTAQEASRSRRQMTVVHDQRACVWAGQDLHLCPRRLRPRYDVGRRQQGEVCVQFTK
jgi:hypothetical protein